MVYNRIILFFPEKLQIVIIWVMFLAYDKILGLAFLF